MTKYILIACWCYALFFAIKINYSEYGIPSLPDARIYYHAAQGEYDWKPNNSPERTNAGWTYPNWTAVFFGWMNLFEEETAIRIMQALAFLSYIFILYKLLKVSYGWLVALLSVKLFAWVLTSGNITAILVALSCTAIGSSFGSIFKPYMLCFTFLHTIGKEFKLWLIQDEYV